MSRKQNIRWLLSELATLVAQGILSADTAERLRQHYRCGETGRSSALVAFSILGALLVGAGIITLLAYNWTGLSRAVRTVISFTPLLAGQIAALWVIRNDKASTSSREGAGTFLMLAVGACVALISQTYHMSGDFETFMLTWMLLSLPIVYLLRASLPAILYLAGIVGWSAGQMHDPDSSRLWIWALVALAIPHIAAVVHNDRYGQRASLLLWACVVTMGVSIWITVKPACGGSTMGLVGASYFSILYLAGSLWFADGPALLQRPFYSVGTAGTVVLSFSLTIHELWRHMGWEGFGHFLSAGLFAAVLALLGLCIFRRLFSRLYFGALPVLMLLGMWVTGESRRAWMMTGLFNLYVFALGLTGLIIGVRERRIGKINGGMLILAVLIVARFFDINIGFVAKGVVFIALGVALLVANIFMSRWMRRAA